MTACMSDSTELFYRLLSLNKVFDRYRYCRQLSVANKNYECVTFCVFVFVSGWKR